MELKINYKDLLIDSSRLKDVRTFLRWERMEITTKECLMKFYQNNECDGYIRFISDNDLIRFEHWLNSLGYYRGVE